jgi:sporulation protein YlmC with PRC-barrel domain
MGKPVRDPAYEQLGELRDVVVDLPSGRVAYVVLGTGGTLGIGEKLLAIPPGAFSIPLVPARDGHVVLHASKEAIDRAPGFARTNWPDVEAVLWGAEQRPGEPDPERAPPGEEFFPVIPTPPGYATGRKTDVRAINRASHLIGMSVKNPRNEDLGGIKDIVLNLPAGTISYLVVGVGGFLGIGEKLLAIPPEAFAIPQDQEREERLVLNASRESMEKASGFPRTNWPDVYQPLPAPDFLAPAERPTIGSPDVPRPRFEPAAEVRSFAGRLSAVHPEQGMLVVEGERETLQFQLHDRTLLSVGQITRPSPGDLRIGDRITVRYQTSAEGQRIAHAIIAEERR